ncbi:MAG: hypothetical protein KDE45_17220 [Caldilineaceae bacterium]|nr:hypothetical protein [Caldilineaceae bacterium]
MAALLHAMERDLTAGWPKFYRQALDIESVRTVQQNLALLHQGTLPESTRRNFPRPSIHRLADMPGLGTRHLLMYDPPGEAFESDSGIEKYAHFVQRAKVVLFLVSIPDLAVPQDSELHRLLETYVLGMTRMKAKTRRQHLVVAYTKADRLKSELSRRPATLEHLNTPTADALRDVKRYREQLRTISDELTSFTVNDLAARSFVRLAKNEFRGVSFCAISALGSPPDDGHLTTTMEPRGVVDPLIWVLEKS